MAPLQQQKERIIIGVDFGTTFSGIAEAFSGTPTAADDIHVINTWPGGSNLTSDKVPSEIAYSEPDNVAGAEDWSFISAFDTSSLQAALPDSASSKDDDLILRWGFQLQSDEPRLRCVKLFLDPRQKMPAFVTRGEIQELLIACGKDAVSVVADYLEQLYKHTQEELSKRYGEVFMRTTAIEWILTVPAIWSDAAKDATLTAAQRAGMGPEIKLISEPEAAAVYTLQAIQPNHLKTGDSFAVVDAGGGTVDLISYEIRQTRPLRIEESAEGSGGCCGSAILNAKFEELIRSKMGAASFDKMKSRTWLTALRYFEEYVKRNFDPNRPVNFNVPFPGMPDDEATGIDQGFMTLAFGEIGKIFGPILDEIIDLVHGQISKVLNKGKVVAGIVLVGGFGQSTCLFKALQMRFGPIGRAAGPPLEVLRPSNAWTAVVRGAVLRGMEGVEMVLNRKSRRHYGTTCTETFDATIHPERLKYWSKERGQWAIDDQMCWFVKKGQTVSSSEPLVFDFFRTFSKNCSNKTAIEEIVVCDNEIAPSHFNKNKKTTRVLCSMVVNLANVPSRFWKTKIDDDGCFYQYIEYQIGMQMESGGLRFDLRVDDVSYGNVTASFDAE